MSSAAHSAPLGHHGSTPVKSPPLAVVALACSEAITLARAFRPNVVAAHPRGSFALTQALQVNDLEHAPTVRLADPADGALILEVTMGHHPNPSPPLEATRNHGARDDGELPTAKHQGVPAECRAVAAMALLARHWGLPDESIGYRSALAGFLIRAGVEPQAVVECITAVSIAAGGRREPSRHRNEVLLVEQRLAAGEEVPGFDELARHVGERVAIQAAGWLGLEPSAGAAEDGQESAADREEPTEVGALVGGSAPTSVRGQSANTENEAPSERIEITHDGVARVFTCRHHETTKYDPLAERWFVWDGSRWRIDEIRTVGHRVRLLVRELTEDKEFAVQRPARTAGFAESVERLMQRDPSHAVTQGHWDQDPWLLGTPGGTVDLRTGRLLSPSLETFITKQTIVTPSDNTDCLMWKAFLHEATGGDVELVRFLQQFCGYCLTGEIIEHALLFLYGPGGNGKSVLLNTIMGIMGDYATASSMDTFTASKGERHPTDLAMLRGARLVSASETEEGKPWAESRIKQLTGGDIISARFMHQNFFSFRPNFKLFIAGNHKPILINVDDAARRRFNMVPFVHRPRNPDRTLEAKLRSEWPQILRWMIEGCLDWQRNGLVRPSAVQAATDAYFDDQDLFGQWLQDRCIVEPGATGRWCASSDLYASWKNYALKAGEDPGTQKKLSANLVKRGLMQQRRSECRGYLGISLSLVTSYSTEPPAY
jgi:putative DNA primase/helicase